MTGDWLSLNHITYRDPQSNERAWEAVYRTTRMSGASSDGVFVIAILRRLLKYDCLVLVKQFRPPVKTYTIEFPAGLCDKDEDPSTTAVRELKEETGYAGVVKHCSPMTCVDAGMTNVTCNMVTVEIDGDDPENVNPTPCPEDTEFIEVINVPLDELLTKLNSFSREGFLVNSLLFTYAIAMEQTEKMTRRLTNRL